jgi:FtsP/CotA-like multicopper oxidase with cupredoxin domain
METTDVKKKLRTQTKSSEGFSVSRRNLLLGSGAIAVAGFSTELLSAGSAVAQRVAQVPPALPSGGMVHIIATDGWGSMPSGSPSVPGFWPDPIAQGAGPYNVYNFGFRDVTSFIFDPTHPERFSLTDPNAASAALVGAFKGTAQTTAPTLYFKQNQEVKMRLTNLGLAIRPDLVDGHTLHWHGFRNAIPLFDGVPEMSVSAPIGGTIEYAYRPHVEGTYMYHCHFEDVEHVQMGMIGLLVVRPGDFDGAVPALRKAYASPATAYDREFPFMINELWAEGHWRDAHIQTTDWTNYDPSFFLMNGRAYPDTVAPAGGFDVNGAPLTPGPLQLQPISSLVTCAPGEKVLLRMANLGFQNHAITADGIEFRVIAKDASCLYRSAADLSYTTNVADIAPGESYDLLFTAPAAGTYRLYDRNYVHNSNNGSGVGGMQTEIQVIDGYAGNAGQDFSFSGHPY